MEVVLAVLGALATLIPVLVKIWNNRIDRRKATTDGLAKIEAQEMDASLARVDAESRRVQPPGE